MQMPTGVVLRRTADLVPYANNARTHTVAGMRIRGEVARESAIMSPTIPI